MENTFKSRMLTAPQTQSFINALTLKGAIFQVNSEGENYYKIIVHNLLSQYEKNRYLDLQKEITGRIATY